MSMFSMDSNREKTLNIMWYDSALSAHLGRHQTRITELLTC